MKSLKEWSKEELEIERSALIVTVAEMSKGIDARMSISLDEFLQSIEKRIKEINAILNDR